MRLSIRIQQTALFVAVILAAMLVVTSWIAGELDRSIRDVVRTEQMRDASALSTIFGAYFPLTADSAAGLRDQVCAARGHLRGRRGRLRRERGRSSRPDAR